MVKNVLIGFLALLLLVAGVFIVRDFREETTDVLEEAGEEETVQSREDEVLIDSEVSSPNEDDVRIVGQWQKSDDSLSTLTFQADGVLIDTYGGGAISETGTYDYVSSESDLPEDTPYDPRATYLRQTFGNQSYYYEVRELNDRTLELYPLSDEGTILNYTRVDY